MKQIEMVDLKSQYEKIKKEINSEVQEVISSAAFIKGEKVRIFQQNLEKYLKVKHVIPVANGTDALQISLMAFGLQPGDEVITPAFTFISTAEVIALLGLNPVFVDVDTDTFNISAEQLHKSITPKTKAIMPVHLFGQNADMENILSIAHGYKLHVIEDACQSIGSVYAFSEGRASASGCMGNVGCTSFFPSKNLGCYGDGGAIFTNDDLLAEKIRSISNHGMKIKYHHDQIGVNSRLDTIQAAILNVKLRYLDEYTRSRQAAADYYDTVLSQNKKIKIPVRSSTSTHVFHQYTIQLQNTDRDSLQKKLKERGIPTMVYYPIPLHLQKAFRYMGHKEGDFPVSEKLSHTVLSLPMHTELDTEQLEYITTNLLQLVEEC